MYPTGVGHTDCNYHTCEIGKEGMGLCGNGKVATDECIGLERCKVACFEPLVPRIQPKNCPDCETDPEQVEGWIHTNPVTPIEHDHFKTFNITNPIPPIPEPESLSFGPGKIVFTKTPGMFGEPSYTLGQSLDEAKQIITGERQDSYGNPEDSFQLIADYWTTYILECIKRSGSMVGANFKLTALDTGHMMILFKIARCSGQQPKRDNYIDIQGYAAIVADRLIPGGSK